VIPGEKMKIKLSVLINNSWAPDFNLGREKLEDILILHLEKGTVCCIILYHLFALLLLLFSHNGKTTTGKDYFISISGSYIQSCFGSTLEHLVPSPTILSCITVFLERLNYASCAHLQVCFPGPVASSPAGPPTATDRLSIPKVNARGCHAERARERARESERERERAESFLRASNNKHLTLCRNCGALWTTSTEREWMRCAFFYFYLALACPVFRLPASQN
jgi:hypothetical protein